MTDLSDLFGLAGKTAFISGSSRGIGFAMAKALASAGATVIINGRDEDHVQKALGSLAESGIQAIGSTFDLTVAEDVEREIGRLEAERGPIDILVNNAGMQHRAPFADFPLDMFDRLMRTNLYSAFYVTRPVVRSMMARKTGSIINICSVQSELGRSSIVPYTASKGAMKMLTKGLATELGPHGIRVNGIGPGYFRTELNEALVQDAEFSRWLVGRTPLARWGEVDELGGAAIFLASDASSFMTGQIIYVDGGMTGSV
ncbi:glucose 1-dehydrogenase [Mesorhizobium sp. M0976]|uniref:glucose 1-dehydrogenase n=1 Tax=Mesorhizobium sp. M0976 TaxID=2957038 RepID=UPI003336CD90